jgi:hypothetical protein
MYNNNMLYIEDVLVNLVKNYVDKITLPTQDYLILTSFHNIYDRGDSLTKSQGQLLLRILEKYKTIFELSGLDYKDALKTPEWKSKFRSLDLSRRIYVEEDDTKKLWVCFRFPYQLKESFEKFLRDVLNCQSMWDHDKKVRKIPLYQCKFIPLNDFLVENNFEIDETFVEAMSMFEEVLDQQENIIPSCDIVNGYVEILNASEEIRDWFSQNRYGNINDDLLLAKSMGYFLSKNPESQIERIAAEESTLFWMQNPRDFLTLARSLSGKFALILDRAHNNYNWLKEFTSVAEDVGFSPNEIKVCFRNDKDRGPELNDWIKESGYGGKIEDGKIFIFNHKPAKWVFKNPTEFRVLITNNIYPPTDSTTKDWFSTHPCVVYLGDIKPSKNKDNKIVDL